MPRIRTLESIQPKGLPAASDASAQEVYKPLRKATSIGPTTNYWQKLKDTIGGAGIPGIGNPESNTYKTTELGGSLMPSSAMTLSDPFTKKQLWDQAETLIKRLDRARAKNIPSSFGQAGRNALYNNIEREIYRAPRTAGLLNRISIGIPESGGSINSSSGSLRDLLEYPFEHTPSGISSRLNTNFLDFSNRNIPEGKLIPPLHMSVSDTAGYNISAHEFAHLGQIAKNPKRFLNPISGYGRTKSPNAVSIPRKPWMEWEMRPEEHLADLREYIRSNPEVRNIKGLGNRLASMYNSPAPWGSATQRMKELNKVQSTAPRAFFTEQLMPYLDERGLLTKDTETALTQALYKSFGVTR
jgi:hypothetical protein